MANEVKAHTKAQMTRGRCEWRRRLSPLYSVPHFSEEIHEKCRCLGVRSSPGDWYINKAMVGRLRDDGVQRWGAGKEVSTWWRLWSRRPLYLVLESGGGGMMDGHASGYTCWQRSDGEMKWGCNVWQLSPRQSIYFAIVLGNVFGEEQGNVFVLLLKGWRIPVMHI